MERALVAGTALVAGAGYLLGLSRRGTPEAKERERATKQSEDLPKPDQVLDFWFGGSIKENYKTKWFPSESSGAQAAMDSIISQTYGQLLIEAENGRLESWKGKSSSCLALIVVLDQFSRHVHRTNRALVDQNDLKALSLARFYIENGWHLTLPSDRLAFLLLPFRHRRTAAAIEQAVNYAQEGLERGDGRHALLTKFLNFSQKEREQTLLSMKRAPEEEAKFGDDHEILEKRAREGQADDAKMARHPLTKAVIAFLKAQRASDYPAIIISLSGGVDSMVIAEILAHLCRAQPKKYTFRVVAIHIDYGNRKESAHEADFVRRWCEQMDIELTVRAITEMKRGSSNRDEYEKLTREIRFGSYKQLQKDTGAAAVCFGHHDGDVRENVISNAMKGQSLTSLGGMTAASIVNGVLIWRPLLGFEKTTVYDFAHKHATPYFKDSTPAWSTRGKLRNKLLPTLEEVYGKGVHANLTKLARQSKELLELVQGTVFDPFLKKAQVSSMCATADLSESTSQPVFFWKEVLKIMYHSLHVGTMRDKAVNEFVGRLKEGWGREKGGDRFQRSPVQNSNASEYQGAQGTTTRVYVRSKKIKDGWMPLKRDNKACIKGGRLYIFKPSVFPFSRGDGKKFDDPKNAHKNVKIGMGTSERERQGIGLWRGIASPGATVQLGENKFGPWTVTVSAVPRTQDPGSTLELLSSTMNHAQVRELLSKSSVEQSQKAAVSERRQLTMMDVCSGKFCYVISKDSSDGEIGSEEGLVVCNLERRSSINGGKPGKGRNGRKKETPKPSSPAFVTVPGTAAFALANLDPKLRAALPAADWASRSGVEAAKGVTQLASSSLSQLLISFEYKEPADDDLPGWKYLR